MSYKQRILTLALAGAALAVFLVVFAYYTLQRPTVEWLQWGYRGTGLVHLVNSRDIQNQQREGLHAVPAADETIDPAGTKASEVYLNVKVLGDLDSNEFLRFMTAITKWVAPVQGCAYCHNEADFADENVVTKIVSRRMIQMTQDLNAKWKSHVAINGQGVTCYTCHRGNPIPKNVWYTPVEPRFSQALLGNLAGQNQRATAVGLTSLPFDPFTPFLVKSDQIRVVGKTALPTTNRMSIKQAEWTYGLMMSMSKSLGVNCTYCHNSQNFQSWGASSPQRVTAWYGIRMVRDINNNYINPLTPLYANVAGRKGPAGDIAKANCATCHQGAFKPLYGVSQLKDYPVLAGPSSAVKTQ
ncbi:photosynthetic reaction center cytochrome c subunit [Rhodomicrobium sp. Az07]|uniref:photosynthetic reaction center cytochrome PufC n=1 Tax=Rhodomicrobium sp. Az07 TaxID=2839034 RepID=UPI001BE5BAC1|nr:photosynthetic reaction center cytochrome PufC [Rhodomicrobium sp. Az07]MBT3070155.1 photosynthetic reaction center cytochrome c subunit [Rhodomicrobium sp. Az07]